jgi:hypothetical protein
MEREDGVVIQHNRVRVLATSRYRALSRIDPKLGHHAPPAAAPTTSSARAGTRRFRRLSSLRTHKKPPYKPDRLWRTLRPPKRPGRARTANGFTSSRRTGCPAGGRSGPSPPSPRRSRRSLLVAPPHAPAPRCPPGTPPSSWCSVGSGSPPPPPRALKDRRARAVITAASQLPPIGVLYT